LQELSELAQSRGVEAGEIVSLLKECKAIQQKAHARQRMLMMRTPMNSLPIIVADALQGGKILAHRALAIYQKLRSSMAKCRLGT